MRFLALFFIRGQRADGPDGPCDGRCVENKRQSKVDRTPQKRFQHTHESRGVVGARGGHHGAGAWVADMACWETHGDVRAPRPHAVVRTWHGWLGHGDGLTSRHASHESPSRTDPSPAGFTKACCYTLFRRRYHPPPDDAPGDTDSSNKLPREEARDRTLMISDCFFCHAAIRTRTFSRRL